MNLLIISTSASEESISRKTIPLLTHSLTQMGAIVDVVDVRDLPPVWVDNRDIADYPKAYKDLFDKVTLSAGVVFVFPIYCYTFSSATKAISEIIGDALEKKPTAFVAASGSARSHLSVGHIMQSMMYEQDTICYPSFVMVNKEMLGEDGEFNPETQERIEEVAKGFYQFSNRFLD